MIGLGSGAAVIAAVVLTIALVPAPAADALVSPGPGQASAPDAWLLGGEFPGVDPVGSPGMGASIAIDGDTAVVGATDIVGGEPIGQVHLLSRETPGLWSMEGTLPNGPADSQGKFGWSLALEGSLLVVGAPLAAAGNVPWAGAVYVYERSSTTWNHAASLTPPDPEVFGGFGRTVDLSGETIVVGSPDAGSTHVFSQANGAWTHTTQLDVQGSAVAVDGDTLAVGEPGAASIYHRTATGWTLEHTEAGPGGFGLAVDLHEDLLVVGAPHQTAEGLLLGSTSPGAVHLLERSAAGWIDVAQLTPDDLSPASSSARFGSSVALTDNGLVVGALAGDPSPGVPPSPTSVRTPCVSVRQVDSCLRPGAAYIFEKTSSGWAQRAKLVPPAAESGAWFGYAIGASTGLETVFVGAPFAGSTIDPAPGSAYAFSPASTFASTDGVGLQ